MSPGASLRLVRSDSGWALTEPGGQVIFQAPGVRGRRRCLQFARAHEVLTILS